MSTDARRMVTIPAELVSEREFQEQVIALLRARGWLWCHFRPARTAGGWRTALSGSPGFPDLVAARGDRLIFIELKSERGRTTAAQNAWLNALEATCKAEVYVAYPSGWGKLVRLLE